MAQRAISGPAETVRGLRDRLAFAHQVALALGTVAVLTLCVTGIVAAIVGPPRFRLHLAMTGESSPLVTEHAGQAFTSAVQIALGIAAGTALVASTALSLWLGRWVSRALEAASATAEAVADHDYSARIPDLRLGPEFAALTDSFNTMAAELEQVETSRRRVLTDLAHELRTPIATITAYLEAMADGVASPDPATLTILRDNTSRLARLAEDIALVTAAEEERLTLHPSPIALADLLQAAFAQAKPHAEAAGITLTLHNDAPGAVLDADAERLGQVLTNLLDNAVRHAATRVEVVASWEGRRPHDGDAGPEGEGVAVSSRSIPGDGERQRNGKVACTVRDDGDGIAEDHLARVFDRFYRVDSARDRARGGSGIGLTIVKAIVEDHHGFVTATSAGPGHGAQFTIVLPGWV
jgi:signal transduction histidine kinase